MTFDNAMLAILLSFTASLVIIAVAYGYVPRLDPPPVIYPTVFRRVWMECEFARPKKSTEPTEYVNCRTIEAQYKTADAF